MVYRSKLHAMIINIFKFVKSQRKMFYCWNITYIFISHACMCTWSTWWYNIYVYLNKKLIYQYYRSGQCRSICMLLIEYVDNLCVDLRGYFSFFNNEKWQLDANLGLL